MRRLLVSLCVVLAAAAAGCGGGGHTKALSMLPNDTEGVVGFDLARARGTDVWAAGESVAAAFAKDDAMKDGMDEVHDALKKLEKKTGLDPVEDVDAVVAGFAHGEDGAKPPFALLVTTRKDLDEKDLVDFIEDVDDSGKGLEKDEVGGVTVYRSEDGKAGLFLWDARTLAFGNADWIDEMAELRAGKGKAKSAADKPELVAAAKKTSSGAAIWFAAATTDEMADGLKKFPMEGIDDAIDFSGSVLVGKDIRATVKIGFKKKEDAADVADTAEAFMKVGKKKLKEKAESVRWAKGLVDAYSIAADGKDVVATLTVSEDVVADAAKWLKKDGTVALLMMGGLFAKKVDAPSAAAFGAAAPAKLRFDAPGAIADDEVGGGGLGIAAVHGIGGSSVRAAAGGACERYAACTRAMAEEYRRVKLPDVAKSMEDAAGMMSSMGSSADASCTMALDAMVKNADLYEKMPKFHFPRAECGAD